VPELPDVEVYRKYVNATALHKYIESTRVESAGILSGISTRGLGRALRHKSFESTCRHGKYLFIALSENGWLVMHFGMTGELKYFRDLQETPDYTRLLINFENGFHLAYIAPRKLGRITLTESPAAFMAQQKLGRDALDISETDFIELASKQRGNVKSWLMNQNIIAGIGNIYSDEILFQAGIRPGHPVKDLGEVAIRKLYKTMRSALQTAIRARANPERMPAGFLLPHRKQDGHCPRCRTHLVHIKVAGRSAWYCPRCQGC
jgi:formamidopyrimidine-DNA glycosylase